MESQERARAFVCTASLSSPISTGAFSPRARFVASIFVFAFTLGIDAQTIALWDGGIAALGLPV